MAITKFDCDSCGRQDIPVTELCAIQIILTKKGMPEGTKVKQLCEDCYTNKKEIVNTI